MGRILIAGCGYVGTELARMLTDDGHSVWGVRRKVAGLPGFVRPVEADLAASETLSVIPASLDAIFYTASPGGSEDVLYRSAYVDGLRNLLELTGRRGESATHILFASSTAVYAQSRGEWVDEASPTTPEHFSGVRLLEAEALLRAAPNPTTVVRFGGIYGPRRTRLIDSVRAGRASYREPLAGGAPQYSNRIHRDDCAGFFRHCLGLATPDPLYVGADDDPAEERLVMEWLAGVLGAPTPRPREAGDAGPVRRGGNKRCRNTRLRATGYELRYPTFREGYAALIDAGRGGSG